MVFPTVLLVPELDEATFAEVLAMLQRTNAAGGDTRSQEEFAESSFPWLHMLQEVLAMPRLREAIEQATPEAWEQARLDYVTLCQFFQTFFAPVIPARPKWVSLLSFAAGGFYLVPVALAIRYWGYGHWIDDGFAWVDEQLTDPDTQARLAEQLAQHRGESPG